MEPDRRIRRIAIVGGGVVGWTAAVMLGRKLGGQCSIHVIDTPEPAFLGRAEATLPPILELLRFLGVDQNDFIDKTQSTYSLGTRNFSTGRRRGQSFWHPFGGFGALIERRPFYHFWHKGRALGLKPKIEVFSQEVAMAVRQSLHLPHQFTRRGSAPAICAARRYGTHVSLPALARRARRRHPARAQGC